MPALSLRDEAEDDLRDAAQWYEGERIGLGREFTQAARALLATVAREPERYPLVRAEVRRALMRRFPYAVYFIVEPESVIVLACVHVRRDPQVWQSRR